MSCALVAAFPAGRVGRRSADGFEDAVWIGLTSQVEPISVQAGDDAALRTLVVVNWTFDHGMRQDGVWGSLERVRR